MGRAPCCDKTAVKRGSWSPEEDALLRNFIESHGTGGNWIALPRKAGLNRCGKSCRLRWLNYLRPDIRHGGFTQQEDYLICTLFSAIGSRWSLIASKLPGRTDNDVKNYWNTKLKKKFIMAGDEVPGFEAGSVPNYSQSVQPNPIQLTETKPEPETNAYDHSYNSNGASNYSMPSSSLVGMKPWESEVPPQESWDPLEIFHGVLEVPSSRCSSIGGSGGGEVEDDIDDFWLRLLVDQSSSFGGSSQVVHHEMINGFESVFDAPFFPSSG